MNLRKAFLGPIGDDLPSLIPILISLIIYFAVFNMAFQQYQALNSAFNDAKTLVTLTESLKGDSFYSNAQEFVDTCKQLSIRGLKFKAAVIDLPAELSNLQIENENNIIVNLINKDNLAGEDFSANCNKGKPQYNAAYGEIIYDCDSDNNPIIMKCSNVEENNENEIVSNNTKISARFFPIAYLDKHVASKYAVRIVFLVVAVWH